jgi:hypothetical protein
MEGEDQRLDDRVDEVDDEDDHRRPYEQPRPDHSLSAQIVDGGAAFDPARREDDIEQLVGAPEIGDAAAYADDDDQNRGK